MQVNSGEFFYCQIMGEQQGRYSGHIRLRMIFLTESSASVTKNMLFRDADVEGAASYIYLFQFLQCIALSFNICFNEIIEINEYWINGTLFGG